MVVVIFQSGFPTSRIILIALSPWGNTNGCFIINIKKTNKRNAMIDGNIKGAKETSCKYRIQVKHLS